MSDVANAASVLVAGSCIGKTCRALTICVYMWNRVRLSFTQRLIIVVYYNLTWGLYWISVFIIVKKLY